MNSYLISGSPLCETLTGIPRYMYEVLTRVDELMDDKALFDITICYPDDMKFVDYQFRNIKVVALSRTGKRWIPQVVVPYSKTHNQTICDMSNGICIKKGTIVKIDDLRPITEKYDPFKIRIMSRIQLHLAKKNASVVITVSESQRSQLRKYMPQKRIEIFPNGFSQIERFDADYRIFEKYSSIKQNEYFYTLGSVAKHKNYKWIVEVARRNPDKQFVVAGNQDLKKWHIDSSGIALPNIVYVGYVSDNENKALYERCRAYVHPALYEGFGMPPLEAVSLGKDVALSNIPEFRETYGDNVSYFEPNEYDFNLDMIKHMDDSVRIDILKRFSWDETANLWYKLFSETGELR